ncbi:MAG: ABC transporter ATP-binding protein [Devosia marina]|uniref:ABC transporter ATP-binding protein n=1 Tax=Devosia marina TaxID=2683198 RepID=UPI0032EF8C30
MLELRNVSKRVGVEKHLDEISLSFERGTLNVLLGPTLSGKTSLMRIMAGLDRPTRGSIHFDGVDVTGVSPQKRDVAMVFQQFINYPTMSVYENIASPMRIAGADKQRIDEAVLRAADLMKLTPYLDRTPLNLSGGQQQRTALARAIAKNAGLVLLDEPLANLDYKLREELRAELPRIFAESGAIFVYATTEPSEALLLGGNTATLSEGRVTQFGPTIDVYRRPEDLITARTFSDPPLNTLAMHKRGDSYVLDGRVEMPASGDLAAVADGEYTVGFQPHHLTLEPSVPHAVRMQAVVTSVEITGSESFVHLRFADADWIMLAPGVQRLEADEEISVFLDPGLVLVFDSVGRAIGRPQAMAA